MKTKNETPVIRFVNQADIAPILKFHRETQDICIAELSRATGINLANLYALEKGEKTIGLKTLFKILNILGYDLAMKKK